MATRAKEIESRPIDTNYSGKPSNNITKGLPKDIQSICPDPDCGICDNHLSHTSLRKIDLTSR